MNNLLEVRNQIAEYFLNSAVLDSADFVKIKVPDGLKDSKDSVIREALKDLEENKLIRGFKKDGADVKGQWCLETPLGYNGQQVAISIQTAALMAKMINQYRKANSINDDYCDLLEITEGDIHNLCLILAKTLSETKE